MGTALVTLSITGSDIAEIKPLLAFTDIIRADNPPWLTVVPAYGNQELHVNRLEKLAKLLTRNSAASALLFFYFDDESFYCNLYQEGKKKASCRRDGSWAKFGKELGALLGDSEIPKAFRYSSKCISIEEQISLLEEAVGTVLYDIQEAPPRLAARSSKTLSVIKEREKMFRNRPNSFCLREVEQKDWPEDLLLQQTLKNILQSRWKNYNRVSLLSANDMGQYIVPGAKKQIVYPYTDLQASKRSLLIYNGDTGEIRDYDSFSDDAHKVLWQTKRKEYVILFHRTDCDDQEPDPRLQHFLKSYVSCINDEGVEQWRFSPTDKLHQSIWHISTSPNGIITLIAPGLNAVIKRDTLIWQIDGETGALINEQRFHYSEQVHHITYDKHLNAFVFIKRAANELLIADEKLEVIRCFHDYHGTYYIEESRFFSHYLWNDNIGKGIQITDLITGAVNTIHLETEAYPKAVLSDGRIFGVNEKQDRLFVFNSEGTMISRMSVPGIITRVLPSEKSVLLVELRFPEHIERGKTPADYNRIASARVWSVEPTA